MQIGRCGISGVAARASDIVAVVTRSESPSSSAPSRERLIEVRKKLFPALMIVLPGIFAVQNDRHEHVVLWRIERHLFDAAQDVLASRVGCRLVVEKAESV